MRICIRQEKSPLARARPLAGLLLGASLFLPLPGLAQTGAPVIPPALAEKLNATQARAYALHLEQRGRFDKQLEMYWALVDERRDHRRRKFTAKLAYTPDDYVREQPPKYAGAPVPPDVAKIIADMTPPSPDKGLPGVADYLTSAKANYGFAPTFIAERDFKRRFALEALTAGLSKTQVVRVYALETGGDGTFDMQAGIHPITKQGRPISSALGYAQLLHANSVSELVKHGDGFVQRLIAMAQQTQTGTPRNVELNAKITALQKMIRVARSVPNEWREHQKLAQTPVGSGIHTLNLDGDVGPWLQVLKLKGLLTTAANEAGRTALSGAELELMNLAGPRTGLEMMQPVGRTMPTTNFFSQQGYYRNTIVREKSGAELLAALEEKMNTHILKPGAVEFEQVFDEVAGGGQPRAQRAPAVQPFGPQSVFTAQ